MYQKSVIFVTNVCNRCHDLLMSMNLSDIAILNIKGSNYCCIISIISKMLKNLLQHTKMGKEI